jgi:hypothetical protein
MEEMQSPDSLEAAAISVMAVSPDLWVTPELRERNPEVFASYSPEKERESTRQATLRIQESTMTTLKDALATCKSLSRSSDSSSADVPLSQHQTPEPVSLSSSDCNHSRPSLTGPKATLARISELLDERVFTGKQAIIAILASVCMPLAVFGLVRAVCLSGLALAIILGCAFYGLVRCYQDMSTRPELQSEPPLHLREYGLMDPTKLQSMVDANVELALSDYPDYSDEPPV